MGALIPLPVAVEVDANFKQIASERSKLVPNSYLWELSRGGEKSLPMKLVHVNERPKVVGVGGCEVRHGNVVGEASEVVENVAGQVELDERVIKRPHLLFDCFGHGHEDRS